MSGAAPPLTPEETALVEAMLEQLCASERARGALDVLIAALGDDEKLGRSHARCRGLALERWRSETR